MQTSDRTNQHDNCHQQYDGFEDICAAEPFSVPETLHWAWTRKTEKERKRKRKRKRKREREKKEREREEERKRKRKKERKENERKSQSVSVHPLQPVALPPAPVLEALPDLRGRVAADALPPN